MVLVEELPEESEMESEDESGPELDPDSDSQVPQFVPLKISVFTLFVVWTFLAAGRFRKGHPQAWHHPQGPGNQSAAQSFHQQRGT